MIRSIILSGLLLDAFGPGRMICGYVGMNAQEYRKWSAGFERAFGSVAASDREKIRVTNAKALFHW